MDNSTPTEIVQHPSGDIDNTERTVLEQDDELSMADFISARSKVDSEETVKEKAGVVEEPKEVVVEEEPVIKEVTEPVIKPTVKTTIDRDSILKDLGITEPAKISAFKKMSNDAFNLVKDTLQKQKEYESETGKLKTELESLKTKKPDTVHPTIYNHPSGYLLNPEYTKLSNATATAKGVLKHWTRQLANIRRGEKWQDLTSNDKGQIFIGETKEPDADGEERVMEELAAAQGYAYQYERNLNELVSSHKTRRDTDEKFIKETENKFFPGYDDPKHETQPAQQKFKDMLPDTMKEYVPTSIFVKTVVNNAVFANKVKALELENASLKAGKGVVAPPPKNKFVSNGAPKAAVNNSLQDDEITVDDFKRKMAGID